MHFLQTLLFSSALVAAAPATGVLTPRSSAVQLGSLSRMSSNEIFQIYHTCWSGKIAWPQNDMPPPVKDKVTKQLAVFTRPKTKPNTLTIHNYCDYDIHYLHLDGANTIKQSVLKARHVYKSSLAGTVWKASKSANLAKATLIEYAVAGKQLWYNLSMIDCLGEKDGKKTFDTSQCVGIEAGLQLGNSQADSFAFQCAPKTWCDDQAYFYPENMCKKANPVRSCAAAYGLTAEFCSSKKSRAV
ncbi:hypothetical protein BDU57DRAFT_510287 [Ampelomyces quisqualis]|uniref:Uncharacterized protein n=1 Tax=Ampelomyces quisqualis TaxID=50730 RepID=A0A6A5R2U1_AMPQU|nr:hypothetical protein BDU57DRAFT_510287 [Ampelomyces quisqualis]